jgi:hypothetical protein
MDDDFHRLGSSLDTVAALPAGSHSVMKRGMFVHFLIAGLVPAIPPSESPSVAAKLSPESPINRRVL